MRFTVNTKLKYLIEYDESLKIINEIFPGLIKQIGNKSEAFSLSLDQIVRYTKYPFSEERLMQIKKEFSFLKGYITEEEKVLAERFRGFAQIKAKDKTQYHHQEAIYPSKVWLDTASNPIQAHGGAVYYEDGVYYWYGENKEYTDGKNGVWTWGIKVYSSYDLYNWEDRGFLVYPNIEDPDSPFFPSNRIDRPHLIKCEKTGKYVLWVKLSGAEASFAILVSDNVLGEYKIVKEFYQPFDNKMGDFDIIMDSKTKNGYLYAEVNHEALCCFRLNDDFTGVDNIICKSYENNKPPFTREAPAIFEANGLIYMITSGMTGYIPNKSDVAATDSPYKPFVSLGSPHVDDESEASFNSQISKVFKVEGSENQFIAMADRWLVDLDVDRKLSSLFTRVVSASFETEKYDVSEEEKRIFHQANKLETANTKMATYVWLPIIVLPPSDEYPMGQIKIEWKDNFTI